MAALLSAGCSALVVGELSSGASAGALAARAGSRALADTLYRKAAKAAARAQPAFRRVRSELVLFNRVSGGLPQDYLPRDVVDHMLEWCATADGWFAESVVAAAAAPAAVAGGASGAAAGAGAEDGDGGAAGGASSGIRTRALAKRARSK